MAPVGAWIVRRYIDNESAMVTDPRRARWLYVRDLIFAVVALGALVAEDWLPLPWSAIAGLWVALMLGFALMHGVRRAGSYRHGWVDGRSAMVAAMVEAQARDMTPSEWLRAEAARDFAIMGLPPPQFSDDEEGER